MRRDDLRQIIVTCLPALAVLVLLAYVAIFTDVHTSTLTRDVAAVAKVHPLTGLLSNLGVLLWCAAASICLFAAFEAGPRVLFRFLLFSGLLSGYLLVDDFFMVHDELAPRYLGLKEHVVVAALGGAVCAYLFAFRRVIYQTPYMMLLAALGFLGVSAVMDTILWRWLTVDGDVEYFLEDGAKWLGIACWCSYYLRTAHLVLAGTVHVAQREEGEIQPVVPASLADRPVVLAVRSMKR